MNRPILITGTQRSGTTITEEVLNGHPQRYITLELMQIKHGHRIFLGSLK